MKNRGLYRRPVRALPKLAISQATLYAYVRRGGSARAVAGFAAAIASRTRTSGGVRAGGAVAGTARHAEFDADMPVMESAIATINEDGPILHGVN